MIKAIAIMSAWMGFVWLLCYSWTSYMYRGKDAETLRHYRNVWLFVLHALAIIIGIITAIAYLIAPKSEGAYIFLWHPVIFIGLAWFQASVIQVLISRRIKDNG